MENVGAASEGNQPKSLTLSHGWTWVLTRKVGDDGVFRIEQTNSADREAPSASIEVHVVDVPWIGHWLRGSYTADEWPPVRNFPGGTVLFMLPDPKPEVWLEQFPDSDDGTWYGHNDTVRGAKNVGRLVLFEEDLQRIVAWLEELSTTFGIDRHAARAAQIARVGSSRGTGTDDRFYTPRTHTPPPENTDPTQVDARTQTLPVSAPTITSEQPPLGPANEAEEVMLFGYTGPGSKEMMQLWPVFIEILNYYFPRNWARRTARFLYISPRIDLSLYDASIKKLLRDTTRNREANRERWARLLAEPGPAWLLELRRAAFQKVEDEQQAIVTFGEAVEATLAHNRGMRRRSLSRMQYLLKCCSANRNRLTHLASGSWYKDPTSALEP